VLRFLSEEWLRALESALRAAAPPEGSAGEEGRTGGAPGARLLLGQLVTGAGTAGVPAGAALVDDEVRYTIALGGGEPPEVVTGSVSGADVTLVTDYGTAVALASGRESVAALLGTGRIKVRGNANALIAAQQALAGLGSALAGLAAATEPI